MSEVALTIVDSSRAIHGTAHGSVAEAFVAALSAEPETIEELEAAVARFQQPIEGYGQLAQFTEGMGKEPWDAGSVFVDMAARIVASESSYSALSAEGEVPYHNGREATDVWLPYRVAEDWLFMNSIVEYQAAAGGRRAEYAAAPRLDTRSVLYGTLTENLVNACAVAGRANLENPVRELHASWLMTPRDDLGGQSPRDVLLMKCEFIDADLHSREWQWGVLGEPAPCLPNHSAAYTFAGFGTHQVVLYYDLVRMLLSRCWRRMRSGKSVSVAKEAARLDRMKAEWMERPRTDLADFCPSHLLELERKRLPVIIPVEKAAVDDDCPLCRAMLDHPKPTFMHLDWCHMDDDFPFSFCRTRAEWEEQQRLDRGTQESPN